jgi:hypothetical protein
MNVRAMKFRARLTYANVMATIAVFVALGGSSYAALKITGKQVVDRSLTARDIKLASLTTREIRDHSLLARDFKAGQLPAGAQGVQGPKGDKGDTGPAGPLLDTLPSGRTLTGAYMIEANATGAGQFFGNGYGYPIKLAAKPTLHVVAAGEVDKPVECLGSESAPTAAPGHLCIYEHSKSNTAGPGAGDPETNFGGKAGTTGFYLQLSSTASGLAWSNGTWAVTAG